MLMVNVLVAIQVWATQWQDSYVTIKCDNSAVVDVVNTGKTRDCVLAAIARNIWLVAALQNIRFKLVHVPGVQNVCADMLSRWGQLKNPFQQLSTIVQDPIWVPIQSSLLHIDLDI